MKHLMLIGLMSLLSMNAAVAQEGSTGDPMLDAVVVFQSRQHPDTVACLNSGFRRHTAMASFMIAKTSDEKIHEYMIENVTDQTVMNQMEDEYKVWASTHDTSAVALRAFENCFAIQGMPLKLGVHGENCFNFDLIPAYIRALKVAGVSADKARQLTDRQFGGKVEPQALNRIFDDIYSGREAPDSYQVSHTMFGACLYQMIYSKKK